MSKVKAIIGARKQTAKDIARGAKYLADKESKPARHSVQEREAAIRRKAKASMKYATKPTSC